MTYLSHAEQVITQLIRQNPSLDYWEMKHLLKQAYPFGLKRGEPYRIWNQVKRRTLCKLFPDIISGRREKPQPASGAFFETRKELRYYKF